MKGDRQGGRRVGSARSACGLRTTCFVVVSLAVGATAAPATSKPVLPALYTAAGATARARLILVGHDGTNVSDNLPVQHITQVAALPRPENGGHIYSFSTTYTNFTPDELKSWRLSFIGGKLVGQTFQIAGNGPDSVTITDVNGPLDKIAVGDTIMVDSVVVRDIPLR